MRLDPIKNLTADDQIDGVAQEDSVIDSIQNNLKQNTSNNLDHQNGGASSSSRSDAQHQHSGAIKLPIKVTNISTAHQINDTLYQNSKVSHSLKKYRK